MAFINTGKTLLAAALLLAGIGAQAAPQALPYATVDAVQSPAWVERGDRRLPLVVGQELQNRDRIVTGDDARVVLRLAEGSAVKLGENATLKVDALGRRDGGVFTAALDVVKGAFRFTTGIFTKGQDRRAVNVRIATITAGIRGTDLWGSSNAERDLVCLIEGKITVLHEKAEPVLMSDPLSFYIAPRGEAPKPVTGVDPQQLAQWARETEAAAGQGMSRRDGRWKVRVATVGSEAEALALYDRLRNAGYPAKIGVSGKARGYRYELQVPHLASEADADMVAYRLASRLGIAAPRAVR